MIFFELIISFQQSKLGITQKRVKIVRIERFSPQFLCPCCRLENYYSFKYCRSKKKLFRLSLSNLCGKIRRAVYQFAHKYALRNNRAAPVEDWQADAQCDSRRKTKARSKTPALERRIQSL